MHSELPLFLGLLTKWIAPSPAPSPPPPSNAGTRSGYTKSLQRCPEMTRCHSHRGIFLARARPYAEKLIELGSTHACRKTGPSQALFSVSLHFPFPARWRLPINKPPQQRPVSKFLLSFPPYIRSTATRLRQQDTHLLFACSSSSSSSTS